MTCLLLLVLLFKIEDGTFHLSCLPFYEATRLQNSTLLFFVSWRVTTITTNFNLTLEIMCRINAQNLTKLFSFSNEYHSPNQETNNAIFDIRDKVDNCKVIMEIFVAMIGFYNLFGNSEYCNLNNGH